MNDMAKPKLSAAAQRIQDLLTARGHKHPVVENAQATRTAAEAAAVVGCTVGQIAKSIVFRASESGKAVLVVTSGSNRVDEGKVSAMVGEPLGKANAEFVRLATGFAIGGVAPLGHPSPIVILVDRDLLAHPTIWAAAGTPNALFALSPAELEEMTGGRIADVKA